MYKKKVLSEVDLIWLSRTNNAVYAMSIFDPPFLTKQIRIITTLNFVWKYAERSDYIT